MTQGPTFEKLCAFCLSVSASLPSVSQTHAPAFRTYMFQLFPPAKPHAGWVVLLPHRRYYGTDRRPGGWDAEPQPMTPRVLAAHWHAHPSQLHTGEKDEWVVGTVVSQSWWKYQLTCWCPVKLSHFGMHRALHMLNERSVCKNATFGVSPAFPFSLNTQDLSFKLHIPRMHQPESSHCLPTPVFIKQEHLCLHHCWQTSTGRRKSSPDKPGFTSSWWDLWYLLSWAGLVFFFFVFFAFLATHRPVRLGSEQTRRLWWGLPPIQASPGCGSVCLRKRRREEKGGGRERGRRREQGELQRHRWRKYLQVKQPPVNPGGANGHTHT